MPVNRKALVLCVAISLLAGATAFSSAQTSDQQAIWKLEHAYCDYVQQNDLTAYLSLWHHDFLGWPSVSTAPVGKDQITDWITSQTAKGFTFKSIEFKPARVQLTGDVAVVCYWITFKWLDKDGKGDPHTLRITHTWLKDAKDWRIIGGMSMPELAPQRN